MVSVGRIGGLVEGVEVVSRIGMRVMVRVALTAVRTRQSSGER